jgi:hypothetical protein
VITCLKGKSGTSSFRLSEDCRLFMTWRLFTETSSALISLWLRKVSLSWVILMSQKLLREVCFKHKLELLTTHHQKFGKINHTTQRVTFGAPVVFSMRSVLLTHLSELMIWMVFVKKSARAFTHLYLPVILKT